VSGGGFCLLGFFFSSRCFAFIYGVLVPSFPLSSVLGLALVYLFAPFSNVIASTDCQDGPISSLSNKNGAHCDVPNIECGAFFFSMACLIINDIVKLFMIFLLGVPLGLLLPFLPFLPFLQLGLGR